MRFQVPNLDDVTEPTELEEVSNVLDLLKRYARYRSKAVSSRRLGHKGTAQTADRNALAVYTLLPDWARFND